MEGVLEQGEQGGALLLSLSCGEPQSLVGLLHHVQVHLQRDMRVQAEQLMLTQQMAVRGRRGVGVSEQAT